LNSSAYWPEPISSSTCLAVIASTAAWIWLVGMLGSNTTTFGPSPLAPATTGAAAGATGAAAGATGAA
jgi:hypothetical protein